MTLREAREGDLEFLQRITQTPGWLANIGPRGTETREGALAYLERSFLTPYREYGYGLWVVEVEGLAVGLSGIVRRPAAPNPDLGYALLPNLRAVDTRRKPAPGCLNGPETAANGPASTPTRRWATRPPTRCFAGSGSPTWE